MRVGLLSVCLLACVLLVHAASLSESVEAEIFNESFDQSQDQNFVSLESQVFDEALAMDELEGFPRITDPSRNPLRQPPAYVSTATPKFSVAPARVVAGGAAVSHLGPRLHKFASQMAAVAKAGAPKVQKVVAAANAYVPKFKKAVASARVAVKKASGFVKKASGVVKKASGAAKAKFVKASTATRRALKKPASVAKKLIAATKKQRSLIPAAKKRVAMKLATAKASAKPVAKAAVKAVKAVPTKVAAVANSAPFKRAMVSTATVRTPNGVAGAWGSVGNEENLALAQISRRMYKDVYSSGASIQVSYKGQCVPGTVLQVVNEKAFVSWLIHVPAMNALVLSFRGTANTDNWKSDLDLVKVPCSLGGVACGMVHEGFLKLWLSHRDAMVKSITSFAAKHNTPLMLVTGHSLGAAVAQLAALDFSVVFSAKQQVIAHVHVTTIGTPRTGDATFSAVFNQKRPTPISLARYAQTFKVLGVTVNDPITRLPLKGMGFQHIGGDESTINLQCTKCKSGLKVVKELHQANQYVASLSAKFGNLPVLPCGTVAPFA